MENTDVALYTPTNELSVYSAVEETRMDMPQASCEAIPKEKVVKAPGTVRKAQGDNVTGTWWVEDFLKERETMATKQNQL